MWINHDDYIEAVEKNSEPLNRIAGFQETIAVQLKTIREGQDKLLQSHAALAEQVGYIEGLPSARNPLGKANVCDGLVALAERLANIEMAFTVQLQALQNELITIRELVGYGHYKAQRPANGQAGKHPAGKRK
jgi:hypothetical protein